MDNNKESKGWNGTKGQIESNREYGDRYIADLFEFYKNHLQDWEEGNSEFDTTTFLENPVFISKKIGLMFWEAFRCSIGILKTGYTTIKMGGEAQPHFQHLEGMRLKQAVMFGTLWEQEVPAEDNQAVEVVKAIRDDPDVEFTPETVIESLEGLREE